MDLVRVQSLTLTGLRARLGGFVTNSREQCGDKHLCNERPLSCREGAMLENTIMFRPLSKECIFSLLYVVDLGIFRTKLRSLRVSGTLAFGLLTV
jgi:hypothetical protein